MTTFPKSGNASNNDETSNFMSLIELMLLSGRRMRIVLIADKLIFEMKENKLFNSINNRTT